MPAVRGSTGKSMPRRARAAGADFNKSLLTDKHEETDVSVPQVGFFFLKKEIFRSFNLWQVPEQNPPVSVCECV